MFREPSKLVEITRFGCVSSTQNSCRKTIINVEAAIGRPVMSTNNCACSTRYLLVNVTHISVCCSNKPLIRVQSTNWVCEYGPRSPTHFFVLGQLTLFSSVERSQQLNCVIPHFDSPRANRLNSYDLEWIKV